MSNIIKAKTWRRPSVNGIEQPEEVLPPMMPLQDFAKVFCVVGFVVQHNGRKVICPEPLNRTGEDKGDYVSGMKQPQRIWPLGHTTHQERKQSILAEKEDTPEARAARLEGYAAKYRELFGLTPKGKLAIKERVKEVITTPDGDTLEMLADDYDDYESPLPLEDTRPPASRGNGSVRQSRIVSFAALLGVASLDD